MWKDFSIQKRFEIMQAKLAKLEAYNNDRSVLIDEIARLNKYLDKLNSELVAESARSENGTAMDCSGLEKSSGDDFPF